MVIKQFPGAEHSSREGEGIGQVGRFMNGQVDATNQVILRVVEHEVMVGAVLVGCMTLPSSRMGLWSCA